jgi:hypothetical protein
MEVICCVCGRENQSKKHVKKLKACSEELMFLRKHCDSAAGEGLCICQNCSRKILTCMGKIREMINSHNEAMTRITSINSDEKFLKGPKILGGEHAPLAVGECVSNNNNDIPTCVLEMCSTPREKVVKRFLSPSTPPVNNTPSRSTSKLKKMRKELTFGKVLKQLRCFLCCTYVCLFVCLTCRILHIAVYFKCCSAV